MQWMIFNGLLDFASDPSQRGGSNTKLGDHATSNPYNVWFIIVYWVKGPTWIGWQSNSIWLRAWPSMSFDNSWRPMTAQYSTSIVHCMASIRVSRTVTILVSRPSAIVGSGPQHSARFPNFCVVWWKGSKIQLQVCWRIVVIRWSCKEVSEGEHWCKVR